MALRTDTRLDYPGHSSTGRCRLRIYDGPNGVPVVMVSELDDNHGPSVTRHAEFIAAIVLERFLPERVEAPEPLLWVEHYPRSVRDNTSLFTFPKYAVSRSSRIVSTYDVVTFASFAIERPRCHIARIGQPTWRPVSQVEVEVLIGQTLPAD